MRKQTLLWVVMGCALLVFGLAKCSEMSTSTGGTLNTVCDGGAEAGCVTAQHDPNSQPDPSPQPDPGPRSGW